MTKKCLVLGSSGGIGRAIVTSILKEGYSVGLQYNKNEAMIQALKSEVPESQWVGAYQADLSTMEGISNLLDQIDAHWNAVVFAGGQMYSGLFQDMDTHDMDELYNVHVKALWLITKKVLPSMIKNKSGNIIVLSSIFGIEGASLEVLYSSVKGAQISFVKGLAKEVAPSGIRVNSVAPGLIGTDMNAHLTEEDMNELEEDIPMGRAGTPEEVANTVCFLLSEKSSYLTGQVIQINGGWA